MAEYEPHADVRIILVGKAGAGKSATGNTILDKDVFRSEMSSASVTENCQEGQQNIGDRTISVIDTPGTFGEMKGKKMMKQIKKCVGMSDPGPHAFLLVIRIGRFTPEERNAVKWIQKNFGKDASMYTIVLFTHADQLKGKPLNKYIEENRDLLLLVNACGQIYHEFNNEKRNDRTQVMELLEKIDSKVKLNGGQYYTNKMFQKVQKKIKLKKFAKIGAASICGAAAIGGAAALGGAALGGAAIAGGSLVAAKAAVAAGAVVAAKAAVAVPAVAAGAAVAAKAAVAVPAVAAGAAVAAKAAVAVPAVAAGAAVAAKAAVAVPAVAAGAAVAAKAAVAVPAVAAGAAVAAKAAVAVPAVAAGAVVTAQAVVAVPAAVPALAVAAGISAVVAESGKIIQNKNKKDK